MKIYIGGAVHPVNLGYETTECEFTVEHDKETVTIKNLSEDAVIVLPIEAFYFDDEISYCGILKS